MVISSEVGTNQAGDTIARVSFNDFKILQVNITQTRNGGGSGMGAVATQPETLEFLKSLQSNPIVLNLSGTSVLDGYTTTEAIDEAVDAMYADLVNRPEATQPTATYLETNLITYLEKSFSGLFFNHADDDLWAMNLRYDNVNGGIADVPSQFNGNITEAFWRSVDEDNLQGYAYTYFGDRLTQGQYAESDCGFTFTQKNDHYTAVYDYDANGNIQSLTRMGKQDVSENVFGTVDALTYQYDGSDINKLVAITESSPQDGINDFQIDIPVLESAAYEYDQNGNLTKDRYRGINVTYLEHVNLPKMIEFILTGESVIFTCTGAGELISRQFYDAQGNPSLSIGYNQGMEYRYGQLNFISIDATSRIKETFGSGNEFRFEHFYNDHLGNLRLAYSDLDQSETVDPDTEILQVTDYYPFGMEHMPFGNLVGLKNNRMFNGKELMAEEGLDWYNYGARMYNPQIGRWNGVDELAESYKFISPYVYTLNSPTNAYDPDGNLVVFVNGFRTDAYAQYLFNRAYLSPPWDHRQRIFSANSALYDYWGGSSGFNGILSTKLRDYHQVFVDGMYKRKSTGGERFLRGLSDGKILARMIHEGIIDLNGETIKIVGHSHGAAHASGLAQALIEADLPVEFILLFAAHQPNQFSAPNPNCMSCGVFQFARTGDHVSSDQSQLPAYARPLVGQSKFGRIEGTDEMILFENGNDDGRGNHGIETYTDMGEFRKAYPNIYRTLFGGN